MRSKFKAGMSGSGKVEKGKRLYAVMEAVGTVKNPDGTVKEIVLTAKKPITEDEAKNYGNYS